jgi:hypothetical protein
LILNGTDKSPADVRAVTVRLCGTNPVAGRYRFRGGALREAVVDRIDYYRRMAGECVQLAHASDNSTTKAALLEMAQTWARLVEHARQAEPIEAFREPDENRH